MSAKPFAAEDAVSSQIIGVAIAVHRAIGPGLLESVYHECMLIELADAGLEVLTEVGVPMVYKNRTLKNHLRLDLLVNDLVIVEIKATEKLLPIHDAQLLTYFRLTEKRLGLLLNFNLPVLKDGIRRLVL